MKMTFGFGFSIVADKIAPEKGIEAAILTVRYDLI
jgi:hypothetical protein